MYFKCIELVARREYWVKKINFPPDVILGTQRQDKENLQRPSTGVKGRYPAETSTPDLHVTTSGQPDCLVVYFQY